jgi:hypothetical protein
MEIKYLILLTLIFLFGCAVYCNSEVMVCIYLFIYFLGFMEF